MLDQPTMRAIRVEGGRGAGALKLAHWQMPQVQPGEFLISVRASGLNHADLYQRDGEWPAPPGAPDTLGVEVAGIVVSDDPTGRFALGARVMALIAGGGYAEFAAVHAGLAAEIPAELGFTEAAALPEALMVGHGNLVEIGAIGPGSRVLIHGGASGMGSMMIQMASDLGARVATTTGNPAKVDRLKALGAGLVLARDGTPSDADVAGGFDLIVDMAGAATLQANLDRLAERGTLILMGILGGTLAEIDIDPILLKRLTVRGTILRPLPLPERCGLAARSYARWLPRLAAGAIRPVVDSVHPLDAVRAAHERLESGQHVGKVVLSLQPPDNA
jgi:NADPH2:quinone reductase